MKKLLTYLSVMLLFAAYSCHTETDIQVSSMLKDGICINSTVVKMQLSNMIEGDQDTKSIVEIDAVEAFQNAMLFCMNPGQNGTIDDSDLIWKNGENEGYYHYTEERVINWPLPWDSNGAAPFVIYVLVNVGNYDEELVSSLETKATNGTLTVGDLKNIVYESPSIMSFKTIETENKGLPQAGVSDKITLTTEVQTETINVYAKCLYAKYEFWLRTESLVDAGYTELQGKYAYANTNTKVYPFIDNYSVPHTSEGLEQMMIQDLATAEDIAALENWTAGNAICLYVLENCQGTDNSNTRWYNQSSITNKEYKNSIAFGIKGKDPEGKSFEADYAVYLGTGNNACVKDFNVVRNWHGTLRISITPDLIGRPQYGIKFTPASAIQVAPGESVTVPFETSESDINNIDFSIYEQDGTTIANGISISASNLIQKVSGSYQYSELGYAGTVTLTASESANEGTYDISAEINNYNGETAYNDYCSLIVQESPLIKAFESNVCFANYVGEWSGYVIPTELYNYDIYIETNTRYNDTDHKSSLLIESSEQGDDLYNNSTVAQREDPTLAQIQHNGSFAGFGYIYNMPAPKNVDAEYYITIEIYDSNRVRQCRKTYNLNLITPYVRVSFIDALSYYKNLNEISYNSDTRTGSYSFALFNSSIMEQKFIDPTTNEEIKEHHFYWATSEELGMTHSEQDEMNFLTKTCCIIEEDEAQNYAYFISDLKTSVPPHSAYPRRIQIDENGVLDAIEPDCYFKITHSIFKGEYTFYPYSTVDSTPRGITIYNAIGNRPNYLSIGEQKQPGDTYLMYGFKQYYFIKMEGLTGEPDISVSIPSDQAPYLKYNLTTTDQDNIYKLALWIDHYENPLSYNANAKPYSATTSDGYDESSGDKTVTMQLRKYCSDNGSTYYASLTIKVLHKRFEICLGNSENGEPLKIHMWNPLGLKFGASFQITHKEKEYAGGDIVWTGFPWIMNISTCGGILYEREDSEWWQNGADAAVLALFVGRNIIGKSLHLNTRDLTNIGASQRFTCKPDYNGGMTNKNLAIQLGHGHTIWDLPDMCAYGLPLWDSLNNGNYGCDWRNYHHVWIENENKLQRITVTISDIRFSNGNPGLIYDNTNLDKYISIPANSNNYGKQFTVTDNRFYKVYIDFVETFTNVPLIGGAILLANADKTSWIARKYEKNPIVWFADPKLLIEKGRVTPSSPDMTITNGVGTLEELIKDGWQFGEPEQYSHIWYMQQKNPSANIND